MIVENYLENREFSGGPENPTGPENKKQPTQSNPPKATHPKGFSSLLQNNHLYKTMSVLLNLPSEVANAVLSEWLTINSWVFLDSAVAIRELRFALHGQFKLLTAPVYDDIDLDDMLDYEWILARGIKLKHLHLEKAYISPTGELKLAIDPTTIETVVVSCSHYSCFSIVNTLENLKSLVLFKPKIMTDIRAELCAQLQSLTISSPSSDSMLYIKKHCKNLKKIKVSYCREEDALLDVVKANPQLEHIEMSVTQETLEYIFAHHQNLHSVSLSILRFVVPSDVNQWIAGRSFLLLKINEVIEYRAKDGYLYLRDFEHSPDLVTLLSSFPQLRKIVYDGMYEQSDEMLRVVLGHSADTVEDFNIGCSCDLTLNALIDVFLLCKRLKSMTLFHQELTNEEVLQLFSPEVPNRLETLTMQGGKNMNIKTIKGVVHNCPYLTKCWIHRVPYMSTEQEKQELDKLRKHRSVNAIGPLKLDVEFVSRSFF